MNETMLKSIQSAIEAATVTHLVTKKPFVDAQDLTHRLEERGLRIVVVDKRREALSRFAQQVGFRGDDVNKLVDIALKELGEPAT